MILLRMSAEKLSHSTREKLFDEIIEHMKSSGAFDEIRVGLIDPIWSHPRFQHIIHNFEAECEKFCKDSNLNETRSYLRNKLNDRFQYHSSTSKDLVKEHIQRLLSEKDKELRSEYFEHARNFLKRFLPVTDKTPIDHPETTPPEPQVEDMDIELTPVENEGSSSMDIGSSNEAEEEPKEQELDDFNDFINEEDIERPRYSPIGNSNLENNEISSYDEQVVKSVKQEPGSCGEAIVDPEEEACHSQDYLQNPPLSTDEDDDELERLTFSSVSTVKTTELHGFDDMILLSDDEANIVGKPAKESVPLEVVQGQINDLQTTSEELKPSEVLEASESDGGCSESNPMGKRTGRPKKANPRYKDFTS